MPRRPRQTSPTGWYHLLNRGADKQDTFSVESDFLHFESLLGRCVDVHGPEVHAYCLMTNHFHLVVRDAEGAVAEFMHDLIGIYSAAYNRRHGRSGPLFGGRYHSVVVADDRQLATLGRYVHRNPLAIVSADRLHSYRWSSHGVYCAERTGPTWLSTNQIGMSSPARYREYVAVGRHGDDVSPASWARRVIPVSSIQAAVMKVIEGDPDLSSASETVRSRAARLHLATVAVALRAATADELARVLELGSANSVRTLARRGRVRRADDPAWNRQHEAILRLLCCESS